jgi:exportin-7
VSYGTRALSNPLPVNTGSDQLNGSSTLHYGKRYKGIWLSVQTLTRVLSGNYVNFGVFELYGDNALKDALHVAISVCLTIPLDEILTYRKVSKAYFAFLEVLCHSHLQTLAKCDDAVFTQIVKSLEAGLRSLDVSISSQCAAAIDVLAATYFKVTTPQDDMGASINSPTQTASQSLVQRINNHPTLFPELLRTLFDIVLFEDCANQWSLSRPMLSLILVNENNYGELKNRIMQTMPPAKRAGMEPSFEKLMHEVTRSLVSRNRDRFTQNLTVFRHEAKS